MDKIPISGQQRRLRVGLTYNLKKTISSELPDDEAEYDDYSTIQAIKDALEQNNCQVELLEATEELPLKLSSHTVDIVFNIAEGIKGRGREAQVPALLNFFQIPFTGSDETTLCIALDKALTKRILTSHHIKTPKYAVVRQGHDPTGLQVPFPAILKPNAEGSSKGISAFSIVSDRKELRQVLARNMAMYKQDMLVEEFIGGREFTVGILGNVNETRVFPPMEIVYKHNNRFNIYSYEVKKEYQTYVEYECPPKINADTQTEMEDTARKIYEILGCNDFARVDFRLSPDGCVYFIEINPLPGLAPGYSDFPMIAGFNSMDYNSLVYNVLAAALKRYGLNAYL
jgi:D-alanine-D-alanine ligase